MVRSYFRHGPTQAFGVIASPASASHFAGRKAFVPAWEDVLVWDVRLGEQVGMWHSSGHTSPVTKLLRAPPTLREDQQVGGSSSRFGSGAEEPRTFAVSYQDGSIRLWLYIPATSSGGSGRDDAHEIVTFNGHKKAVTALCWDARGTRLFSGGMEGEIIVWDCVGEVGLFRLKGHKGPITTIHHIPHPTSTLHPGYVLSSSKDTFLKLWDLSTQHCIQTVVAGRAEVLSCTARHVVDLLPKDELEANGNMRVDRPRELDSIVGSRDGWLILTGGGDGDVRCWSISDRSLQAGLKEDENGQLVALVKPLGALTISGTPLTLTNPIQCISFHPNPSIPLILMQTTDKSITALRIRSEEELEAKRARRKKREREKAKKGKLAQEVAEGDKEDDEKSSGTWIDRVTDWCVVRAGGKIRHSSLVSTETGSESQGLQLLLSLSNNSLETYTIPTPPLPGGKSTSARAMKTASASGQIEASRTHVLELQGHRNDVRALSVSSDDQVLASASNGSLKIWNLKTTACIRTMECGYAICTLFLPDNRHVLVGTKSGELELYDIAGSTLLETIKGHDGPIWSMDVRADKGGIVTGSADKDVKFWDLRLKEVAGEGSKITTRLGEERVITTKQLSLLHVKTLKMTDDVLAVKYSADGRLLAVSLLDSTVKVFFQDTLKFFLSLYGHKLPVLAMDISSDSKLIITCSADKNVKIWGLDFGDCHKSIFAHEESIMQIAFERNTHYFWTVGKDRLVKYWDADKFELIQKLEGHHGEIWALAVSNYGEFVVSGSHDKSIRVWEKTDDPLFLEEERERDLEKMYETGLADNMNRAEGRIGDPDADDDAEVEAVQKHTAETLMAGEKIMEAIELADADRASTREYMESKAKATGDLAEALMPPARSGLLIAMGSPEPEAYVLSVLEKIPTASMEDALLVLPFRQVISLIEYLDMWAEADANVTLVSRILLFLLRTHHAQIVSNRVMRTTLLDLKLHLRGSLKRQKDTLGYNMAALKYIKRQSEANRTAGILEEGMMDEAKVRELIEEGRKKRKRVTVA